MSSCFGTIGDASSAEGHFAETDERTSSMILSVGMMVTISVPTHDQRTKETRQKCSGFKKEGKTEVASGVK